MGLALASGDILRGKYRLEQVLGRGGMGTVHLATHLVIGQRVAIKIVNPSASDHEYVVARFLREARAAALLESEHVVRILDVDAIDDGGGTPFMVMEYLHGSDLGAILRKGGRLPLQEAVGYILEACEALAEAHAAGIVHRDLKPSNLFRADTSRKEPIIKLLDFGISKLAAPGEDLSLTDTQAVIGSPLFMSPEQLLSSRDVDHRTDIWSLGVTLYQLAAGALPFEASSASALGAQIAARAPRTLSTVLPEVPRDLEGVVMRCLARAPEDRFDDVASLARALALSLPDKRNEDAARAVERAAERGARGRLAPVNQGSVAPPPEVAAIEASGERWTQSRAAGSGEREGLATGSREKRIQPSTVAHPSGPPMPVVPPAPVTQPISLTAPASPVALGHTPPPTIQLPSTAAPVVVVAPAPRRRGGLVVLLLIIAALIAAAAVFVVVMKRRQQPVAATTPSAVTTPAETTPTPSLSVSSSLSASSSSSSSPSPPPPSAIVSAARPPAPPHSRGGGTRTTKPGATWSKDPSELELK